MSDQCNNNVIEASNPPSLENVMDRADQVRRVFDEYHGRQGADRNDAYLKPAVRLQNLYSELCFVEALSATRADRSSSEVLDVGAGNGASLATFISLGFPYRRLHGIDVVPEYVADGRQRWPHLDLQVMDGTKMTFPSARFDIVTSSGVFVQITDDAVAGQIAAEMVRVLKPGGHLVIRDWWFPHPDKARYRALGASRRARLFHQGLSIRHHRYFRGSLVPPLGRFLSSYVPWLYGPVHGLLPFLAAQSTWVWRKDDPAA